MSWDRDAHGRLSRRLLELRDSPRLPAGYKADLTRAAQLVNTMAIETLSDACPVCGGGVTQPDRGRRRTYCSARCRRRAEREKLGETA